jgi:hypothetical protein
MDDWELHRGRQVHRDAAGKFCPAPVAAVASADPDEVLRRDAGRLGQAGAMLRELMLEEGRGYQSEAGHDCQSEAADAEDHQARPVCLAHQEQRQPVAVADAVLKREAELDAPPQDSVAGRELAHLGESVGPAWELGAHPAAEQRDAALATVHQQASVQLAALAKIVEFVALQRLGPVWLRQARAVLPLLRAVALQVSPRQEGRAQL